MNKWKQIVAAIVVSLIAAATMAQDYTTTQQSRRLAVDNPENTYILGTDGKYNHWYSRASLMASVSVTITKQTGAVTATGVISPSSLTTNGTITINFTPQYVDMGGTNVMTNAIITATFVPQDVSPTVVITVIGGAAVMTNATASVP